MSAQSQEDRHNTTVIAYCQQRERYLALHRATVDERAENTDAIRTLGGLLTESMQRNDVRCVRVATGGTVNYLRIVPARRRAKKLNTTEDVLALLSGVGAEVTDVSFEELPNALARVIQERARQQGGTVPPRVQVTSRVGIRERITEVDQASREVEQLSRQMQSSHVERDQLRKRINPVRAEMKRYERMLVGGDDSKMPPPAATTTAVALATTPSQSSQSSLPPPPPPPSILVRVQQHPPSEGTPDGTPGGSRALTPQARLLRVRQQTYVKRRNIFGLRQVCGYVREAAERLPARDDTLEATLKTEVRRIIEAAQAQPTEYATKITVRRAAASSAAYTAASTTASTAASTATSSAASSTASSAAETAT